MDKQTEIFKLKVDAAKAAKKMFDAAVIADKFRADAKAADDAANKAWGVFTTADRVWVAYEAANATAKAIYEAADEPLAATKENING